MHRHLNVITVNFQIQKLICEIVDGTAIPTNDAVEACRIMSVRDGCSHGFETKCEGTTAKCEIYINPQASWGNGQDICGNKHLWCYDRHVNNVAKRDFCREVLPDSAIPT